MGCQVYLIYPDFDKVSHKKLIKKLKVYDFKKELVTWIESWLFDRRQRRGIGGEFSE